MRSLLNADLRLYYVQVGWRVKHFLPRRNGLYLHGTVISLSPHDGWCEVLWDDRKKSPVMVNCLMASDVPKPDFVDRRRRA